MREEQARQIILGPVITEKGTLIQEKNNQYLFRVDRRANKIQVRDAMETIFQVSVTGVRIITVHGKMRRLGRVAGRRPSWKKAIVSLKDGESISIV